MKYRLIVGFAVGLPLMVLGLGGKPLIASAATGACTAPATDYGTVTSSVTIPAGTATATYHVWSRMAADNTTDNNYLLEIDGSTTNCFDVGSSGVKSVPVYTATQDANNARFNNDTTNWLHTDTSGAAVDVTLPAGTTTIKMIGNTPNLVLDRLIFTQDGTCTPTGTGDNCTPVADTTPPVGNITSPVTNAIISGTINVQVAASDNVAVTGVDVYDGSTKLGSASLNTGTSASGTWLYSWNTAGLAAGSSHVLTAKITDGSTPVQTSAAVTVKIKDTTNPTASVTAPPNGSTQSGTINVTANASDNVAVTKVELYVDGTLDSTDSTSPYSFSLNTTSLTNASHTLMVKAYDAAGNIGPASESITVNNIVTQPPDTTPPTETVTAPAANATISGTYNVTATATDASGIKQVQLFIDNATTPEISDTVASAGNVYNLPFDTTQFSNGVHTLKVVATDNSTNLNQTPKTVSVTISNTAFLPEDINQDGHVNILDFSLLASKFGQSGSGLGRIDINGDGTVNILDFSLLASKFGQ